jgi:hypothetical protein
MKILFASFAVLAASASLAGNLAVNGDFSSPFKNGWFGGNFGGGEGGIRIESGKNGNPFAVIEKTRGPGGSQLISQAVSLQDATRFRFSMRYRRNGGLAFLRYRVFDGRHWRVLKGPTGAEVSITLHDLKVSSGGQWLSYERIVEIPRLVQAEKPGLTLQFQAYPEKDGTAGFFEIDDIVIEPLAAVQIQEKPRVSLSVKKSPLVDGYRPVEKIFPWKWEIKNGLFYRNGRPYFFCGWGDATGGGMEGAVGVWLARLQGMRFLGTYFQPGIQVLKNGDADYVAVSRSNPGWISWQRESARFGMLTEPHPLISYNAHSPLGKFTSEHPEWKEIYFDLGHYVSTDTGNPIGREIWTEARRQYFGYTFPMSGTDYCELAREPGIENCNVRMLGVFRRFVRRKYGDDLELVNRIWGTDFKSWEDVRPLHLDRDAIAASSQWLALRRYVQAKHQAHYYDFIRFMQLDTAYRTRKEFEDMRKAVPGLPVTVDMRAHHAYTDGYCAFDPELIAPYEDVCHVHHGYEARTYNRSPWHEPTLADQTAYPFMAYGYMTRNTSKPVVQSEDIVSRALLPGSNAEAMAENDYAKLHKRPWKFRLEVGGEDGLTAKWYEKDFDDSSWGEVKVPGSWDEQNAYKGRTGVGWYRARFRLERLLRNDYLDGSRRFLVHGKGVAQRGTLWVNGKKVGNVEGWDSGYSFDVGALLEYGGENEIVWRVVGDNYRNGLRFACHVLRSDMLNSAKPFAERQYAQMYWTYMMRGISGVLNWNWGGDPLMPYLPHVIAPLETAAAVALEDVRSRRSKVAYLFGYLSDRGLPFPGEGRHHAAMKWYNAVEFSGIRPDVVSERTFVREVTPEKYPLLIVPDARLVEDRTYAHFKKYLSLGGKALITTNSLRKTFARHAPTDIDSLSEGVVRFNADLPLDELMRRLKPHLPEPTADQAFTVESAEKGEIPLIERLLAGGDGAKVLYLNNWGGFDHPLSVTLPGEYASWRLTPLRGRFVRDGAMLKTSVKSQDVAACLLTRDAPEPWMTVRPAAANQAAWDKILKLNSGADTGKPDVLWAGDRHLYPYLLERFAAYGYDNVAPCPPEEWTPELLAKTDIVVIAEGATRKLQAALRRKDFVPMLKRWVENGGSLYVMAFSAGTINAYGNVLRSVAGAFKLHGAWASVPKGADTSPMGDDWQILSGDLAGGTPLTEGVGKVQLFTLTPMKIGRGGSVIPVVRIPAGADKHAGELAMGAVECGKGRVFVSADAMFCQPMRIELADNAALLENIVGWLARRQVTQKMRDDFRRNGLFLGESVFR